MPLDEHHLEAGQIRRHLAQSLEGGRDVAALVARRHDHADRRPFLRRRREVGRQHDDRGKVEMPQQRHRRQQAVHERTQAEQPQRRIHRRPRPDHSETSQARDVFQIGVGHERGRCRSRAQAQAVGEAVDERKVRVVQDRDHARLAVDLAADEAEQPLDIKRVVEVAVEQHDAALPRSAQVGQRVTGGGGRLPRTVNQIEENAPIVIEPRVLDETIVIASESRDLGGEQAIGVFGPAAIAHGRHAESADCVTRVNRMSM